MPFLELLFALTVTAALAAALGYEGNAALTVRPILGLVAGIFSILWARVFFVWFAGSMWDKLSGCGERCGTGRADFGEQIILLAPALATVPAIAWRVAYLSNYGVCLARYGFVITATTWIWSMLMLMVRPFLI